MTKYFKKSKKTYFESILGLFCPNLGKNEFSQKTGICQILNIPIIYHRTKTHTKTNDVFLKQTDNGDFIGPSVGQGSNKGKTRRNAWKQ